MNADQHFKVVSVVGAGALAHDLNDSGALRAGRARARSRSSTTARWRCSPAARCRTTSRTTASRPSSCTRSGARSWSRWTATWCELWQAGDWKTFCGMLPEYADKCQGEGDMHDTAMLLGLLGWARVHAPGGSGHALLRQLRARGRSTRSFRSRRVSGRRSRRQASSAEGYTSSHAS